MKKEFHKKEEKEKKPKEILEIEDIVPINVFPEDTDDSLDIEDIYEDEDLN